MHIWVNSQKRAVHWFWPLQLIKCSYSRRVKGKMFDICHIWIEKWWLYSYILSFLSYLYTLQKGSYNCISEIEERKRRVFSKQQNRSLIIIQQWKTGLKAIKETKDWGEANQTTEGGEAGDGTSVGSMGVFSLPPALQGIPDLPPSLLPPTAESLMRAKDVDWGWCTHRGEQLGTVVEQHSA